MSRIASFDVFDTVLTRLIGSPRQVFVETGRRLRAAGVVGLDPEAYAAVREQVMSELTFDVAHHPLLRTVLTEVASRIALPPAHVETLHDTELAVENDACRAVPGMAACIAAARTSTGRGVVFVSDTPLPADHLQALLEREGLFAAGDRLYTSAEAGASKQHGGLYDLVRDDQQASSADFDHLDFDHLGDDDEADVVHARLHGWRATLVTDARLTEAEWRLDRAAVATDGLGPRLAGAARMGRLRAVADGADPDISAIAGGTALPLLVAFALWTLSQARLLGLDRLHFVARDGEIIMPIVQALADVRGDGVECRYLYGSRRVWQLAARGTAAHDGELWLPDATAGSERTLAEVLELVGVTAAEARELTGDTVFDADPDQPLGAHRFESVRTLLNGEPLRTRTREAARHRRDLMVRYLDTERVTADGAAGIVDVGWTGRATKALEDVLADTGRPLPAAHLFIGLLADAPDVMGPDLFARSRGWLVDEPAGRRLALDADEDLVMLIETFTMGSEGSTAGYEDVDGTVSARLAAPANPAVTQWRFDDYRLALRLALEAFTDGYLPTVEVDLRPLASDRLIALWRRPTAAQARVWGAQPYGEDFYNARWHPLATPLTTRRLLTRAGVGRPEWREPTYWTAGTVAISPLPWRTLIGAALRLRHVVSRLRRAPRRVRSELVRRRPTGTR